MSIHNTVPDPNLWGGKIELGADMATSTDQSIYAWRFQDGTLKLVKELIDDELKSLYAELRRRQRKLQITVHKITQSSNVPLNTVGPGRFLDDTERTNLLKAQEDLGEIQLPIQELYREAKRREMDTLLDHLS